MGRPKSTRICDVKECGKKHYSRGYCHWHYTKVYMLHKPIVKQPRLCSVEGCGRVHEGNGYCSMHNERYKKYGNPLTKLKAGRKSYGGHEAYKNHALMKRVRLEVLAAHPFCELCGVGKSRLVHHRDGKKTKHTHANLMALCGQKCHKLMHRKLKAYKEFLKLDKRFGKFFTVDDVWEMSKPTFISRMPAFGKKSISLTKT